MARVIISAGHTNQDPGTIANGVREADLTKQIAREVVKQLREANVITLSVPPELDLAKRIEWINLTGYSETTGDITVEIHINDGGKRGIEGWFQADKTNSQKLTDDVLGEVTKTTGWPNQGNHNEYEHPLGSLAFLHNTHPIASLVECGYLDNEEDFKLLTSADGITKIASGIANGIKKFLGISAKPATINAGATNPAAAPTNVATNMPAITSVDSSKITNVPNTNIQNTNPVLIPSPVTVPKTTQTAPINNPTTDTNRLVTPTPTPSYTVPTSTYGGAGGSMGGVASGTSGMSSGASMGSYGGMGLGGMNTGMGGMPGNYGMSAGMGGAGGTGFGGQGGFMSRDQRRDMVKNNYIKILGREPSPADLNYFLNIGINEEQLIRKMVDSQEHADLVKARQEVIQIKKQFIDQRNEILRLKTKVNDQRGILQNLNNLLMQKNRAIVDQQQKLQVATLTGGAKPKPKKVKYKKNKSEKFLDYFSNKLGK